MERLRIAVCHRPPLLLPAPRDLHRRRRLHLPSPLSLPHGFRSSLSSPFADEEEEDSIHFAFFHHHPLPPPPTTATMASPPPRSATCTSTSSAEPHSSAPQATRASAPPSRPVRLGGLSLRKCHTGTGAVSATRSPALGNAENLREVLLYDEPTAGLDPLASTVVEDLIRSMHVTGKDALGKPGMIASYVVVTHQHSTIRRAVDRLLFLHEGKIVWEGMTQESTTSTNPIVQQFASGSLDGPIQYF